MADHDPNDDTVLRQPAPYRLATRDELVGPSSPRGQLTAEEAALVAGAVGPISPQEIADKLRCIKGDLRVVRTTCDAADAIEALTAKNQRLTDALNTSVLEACEAIDALKAEVGRLKANMTAAHAAAKEAAR